MFNISVSKQCFALNLLYRGCSVWFYFGYIQVFWHSAAIVCVDYSLNKLTQCSVRKLLAVLWCPCTLNYALHLSLLLLFFMPTGTSFPGLLLLLLLWAPK